MLKNTGLPMPSNLAEKRKGAPKMTRNGQVTNAQSAAVTKLPKPNSNGATATKPALSSCRLFMPKRGKRAFSKVESTTAKTNSSSVPAELTTDTPTREATTANSQCSVAPAAEYSTSLPTPSTEEVYSCAAVPFKVPVRSSSLRTSKPTESRVVKEEAVNSHANGSEVANGSIEQSTLPACSNATDRNEMQSEGLTVDVLSKIYGSCIPPHPSSEARQVESMRCEHSIPSIGPKHLSGTSAALKNSTSSAPGRTCKSQSADLSASAFRSCFTNPFQTLDSGRPKTLAAGRQPPISRPLPNVHPELSWSTPRPYEAHDAGEPPLRVRSATVPKPVDPVKEIEALPQTSMKFEGPSPNGNLNMASASRRWALLKSLATKNFVPSSRAFSWRVKRSTSPLRRNAHQKHSSQRPPATGARLPEVKGISKQVSACPTISDSNLPRRPPRRQTTRSIFETESQSQSDEFPGARKNSSGSPLSKTAVSIESVYEQERVARHRRNAYIALDGQVHHRPTGRSRSPKSVAGTSLSISPVDTSNCRSSQRKQMLRIKSEKEMLALHIVEKGPRPESPTLPLNSDSISEDDSPQTRTVAVPITQSNVGHFDQAILTSQGRTRAWWEDSANNTDCAASDYTFNESQLDQCESPSIRTNATRGTTERQSVSYSAGSTGKSPPKLYVTAQRMSKTSQSRLRAVLQKNRESQHSPVASCERQNTPVAVGKEAVHTIDGFNVTIEQPSIASDNDPSLGEVSARGSGGEGSSSDSSLSAKATALRHGKELKNMNEYEAAHAVDHTPTVALSQCSLGLSDQQKQALKPAPLRPSVKPSPTPVSPCAKDSGSGSGSEEAVNCLPPMPPDSESRAVNGLTTSSSQQIQSTPPPVPSRSKHRPRLGGDWTVSELQGLKYGILCERPAAYKHPCDLSTITEEYPSILAEHASQTTMNSQQSGTCNHYSVKRSSISSQDTASTINAHDEHWWSDDDYKTNNGINSTPAAALSSKDTTPEKDALQLNLINSKSTLTSGDLINFDETQDVEQEILRYYLDKQAREEKRSPKERLRREIRRQAQLQANNASQDLLGADIKIDDAVGEREQEEQASLLREAKDGKKRAVDVVHSGGQGGDVDRDLRLRRERLQEQQRAARVRGVIMGLRRDSEDDASWI